MNNIVHLYCQENCPPCHKVKEALSVLLDDHPEYKEYVRLFAIECQPGDRTRYVLNAFPTALILDWEGNEIRRMSGGTALIDGGLEEMIQETMEKSYV